MEQLKIKWDFFQPFSGFSPCTVMDKSSKDRLKRTGKVMKLLKHPPEPMERLQRIPLNLKSALCNRAQMCSVLV